MSKYTEFSEKEKDEKKRFTAPSQSSAAGIAIISTVIAVAVILAAVVAWHQMKNGGLCLLLSLTGYPCPSCGLTRATLNALRGDLVSAFSYHPLFFVPYLMVGSGLCAIPLKKIRKYILAAILIMCLAMMVCWAIRLVLGWRGYSPI